LTNDFDELAVIPESKLIEVRTKDVDAKSRDRNLGTQYLIEGKKWTDNKRGKDIINKK